MGGLFFLPSPKDRFVNGFLTLLDTPQQGHENEQIPY